MKHDLPRSAPEVQGVPSQAVEAFLDALEANPDPHGVVLVRHGTVVAEAYWQPYRSDLPHMLYSLSKSFTSTAVGLAVADGLLTVDDAVISFFPDNAPTDAPPNLMAMRVRHLLTMSTGHHVDVTGPTLGAPGSPYTAFFAQPVQHEPGTHFAYNSAASFMLAAIVQQRTGKTVLDYLRPRLLEPLGVTDAYWEAHHNGVNYGGWGLYLRTSEIARFGQLLLQNGMWDGRQLVPAQWVAEATRAHVPNGTGPESDWNQGYGYQFWRCRNNAYRGDGAFGQFCLVMPEQDAVVAVNAGVANLQGVLDAVWTHLMPSMKSAPIAEDEAANTRLRERIASCRFAPPSGTRISPLERSVTDTPYQFLANDAGMRTVAFDFEANTISIGLDSTTTPRASDSGNMRPARKAENGSMDDARGTHRLHFGRQEWVDNVSPLGAAGPPSAPGSTPLHVAASGTWTADDRFELTLRQTQTPHVLTIGCTFGSDTVTFTRSYNVSFGPNELPELVATRHSQSIGV